MRASLAQMDPAILLLRAIPLSTPERRGRDPRENMLARPPPAGSVQLHSCYRLLEVIGPPAERRKFFEGSGALVKGMVEGSTSERGKSPLDAAMWAMPR